MGFRIKGLNPNRFRKYYGQPEHRLKASGVIRCRVDTQPGYPDRITMQDLSIGDSVLLMNYEHLPVNSPYRSSHAVFVKEGAEVAYDEVDIVPDVMKRRTISLRGISRAGHIVDARLASGNAIKPAIEGLFGDEEIAYIHAHYAERGCYSGMVERA